jgi:hypothetical protein
VPLDAKVDHLYRWMCDKERGVEEDDDNIIHPLWAESVDPFSQNNCLY